LDIFALSISLRSAGFFRQSLNLLLFTLGFSTVMTGLATMPCDGLCDADIAYDKCLKYATNKPIINHMNILKITNANIYSIVTYNIAIGMYI